MIDRTDQTSLRALALPWGIATTALLVIWAVPDIDPVTLLGDPAAVTGQPRYLGFFANLAVLGWTVTAVIFLGTAWVIRTGGASRRLVSLCASAGVITTFLMLDDLLQLHVWAARRGFPKPLAFGIYAVAVLGWVLVFRREIAGTPRAVLLAAGAMFTIAIGIDVFFKATDARWQLIAEDGAKLLGILALAVYAAGTARLLISALTRSPRVLSDP